jgi:hypothetical protein
MKNGFGVMLDDLVAAGYTLLVLALSRCCSMDKELEDLSVRVGQALLERKSMLACAESCTGGWVAEVVTAPAAARNGSSAATSPIPTPPSRNCSGSGPRPCARRARSAKRSCARWRPGRSGAAMPRRRWRFRALRGRRVAHLVSQWAPYALPGSCGRGADGGDCKLLRRPRGGAPPVGGPCPARPAPEAFLSKR